MGHTRSIIVALILVSTSILAQPLTPSELAWKHRRPDWLLKSMFWYSALSKVYSDYGTNGANAGDNVLMWGDKSPAGNNYSLTTPDTNSFTLALDISGLPEIQSKGAMLANSASIEQPFTVIFMAKVQIPYWAYVGSDFASPAYLFGGGSEVGVKFQDQTITNNILVTGELGDYAINPTIYGDFFTTNEWHIVTIGVSNSASLLRLDAGPFYAGDLGTNRLSSISIGGSTGADTLWLSSYREIIGFPWLLTTNQMETVRGYIFGHWNH